MKNFLCTKHTKGRLGFTLPELLITLTLVLILISLGVPSFSTLITRQKAKTTLRQLTHLIAFARKRAIETGETITLCHSNDQRTCSGSWSEGQVVLGEDHQVLRVGNPVPKGVFLTMKGFLSNHKLIFTPSGHTAAQNARFTLTAKGSTLPTLLVNRVGRVRIKRA